MFDLEAHEAGYLYQHDVRAKTGQEYIKWILSMDCDQDRKTQSLPSARI